MKDAQTNWDCIVFGSELEAEARRRATQYEEQRVHVGDEDKLVNKGWCLAKTSKNGMYLTLRHDKNVGNAFEDQVWTMFKKLGFKGLNKGRNFIIWASDSKHKQIDVFAVDDDVVVIVSDGDSGAACSVEGLVKVEYKEERDCANFVSSVPSETATDKDDRWVLGT